MKPRMRAPAGRLEHLPPRSSQHPFGQPGNLGSVVEQQASGKLVRVRVADA